MRDEGTDWRGLCRICDLAATDRCRSCPTRTQAFMRAMMMWHDRHRVLVAWCALTGSIVTAIQVVR